MVAFFSEYALFLLESLTVLAAVLVVVARLISLGGRPRDRDGVHLDIRRLDQRYRKMARAIQRHTLGRKALKALHKEDSGQEKARDKGKVAPRRRVFVLDFHGDVRASQVTWLRDEVTAILAAAQDGDEVLLRLESPGGVVHGYGLAASQLERIRQRGLHLTIAVDKVAASGGYMMATVADRILAAPFAVLGSIGVIAQIPNFHKVLQRHEVDFELHTAGKHKRNITIFGQNTDEGRDQLRLELEDIHSLFKDLIHRYRPTLNLDEVADGRTFYGTRAVELGLADSLQTSDDWLLAASKEADLLQIRCKPNVGLGDRLSAWVAATVASATQRATERALDEVAARQLAPPIH